MNSIAYIYCAASPSRQPDDGHHYFGHLHDQPGSHRIQHRHAKDIAASEF